MWLANSARAPRKLIYARRRYVEFFHWHDKRTGTLWEGR
jgi:hypothetical protein